MKREDFKKIIKLRSFWKIDRRKGNYTLPSGQKLTVYVKRLVETQMKVDSLLIDSDGNLYPGKGGGWDIETKDFENFIIFKPFKESEVCLYDEMDKRINKLVSEIIG